MQLLYGISLANSVSRASLKVNHCVCTEYEGVLVTGGAVGSILGCSGDACA